MARPSAAKQARRMLTLLNRLQENSQISIEQLAQEMDVSPTQMEADLSKLSCCGVEDFTRIPIYIEDGIVHIFDDMPALQQPLRLSVAEARAIAAALDIAGISNSASLAQKLFEATATESFDAQKMHSLMQAGEGLGTGETLQALAYAIDKKHVATIGYQTPGKELGTRDIEPLGLRMEQNTWYLEAFCLQSQGLRIFRVDRIQSVAMLPETFEPRELEFSLTVMPKEDLPLAVIALRGIRDVETLNWPGLRVVNETEDDNLLVEVPYSGPNWIVQEVVSLLGKAEIVSPPQLRELVRKEAAKLRTR